MAAEVGGAVALALVEQRVAPGVHVGEVLAEDGADHPVAVLEVVLESDRVPGARRPGDLPQADAVDPVGREQLLGRREDPLPGRLGCCGRLSTPTRQASRGPGWIRRLTAIVRRPP